jgi:hypothetical protein
MWFLDGPLESPNSQIMTYTMTLEASHDAFLHCPARVGGDATIKLRHSILLLIPLFSSFFRNRASLLKIKLSCFFFLIKFDTFFIVIYLF